MKKNCPPEFIKFAERLADISGHVIKKYFRQPHKIDAKDDLSPVTIADLEAEQEMRREIEKFYPDHNIIGEEFGHKKTNSAYTWILDPIDGTSSFMIGRPIFGTLISLLEGEIPILGVINQPINNERWIGANGKTTFNSVPVYARQNIPLSEAVLCTTSRELFAFEEGRFFDNVRAKCRYANYGGDCYSYGLIALGLVDIVIESGLKPHDYCALRPIIEGAGGVFIDFKGKEITLNSSGQVIAAGSKELAEEILRNYMRTECLNQP